MTSNNAKQAVRAIMADNPGMKYTEALRLHSETETRPESPSPFGVGIDIRTVDPDESVTLTDPLRGTIVSGSTGSGKSVTVQGIITGAVRAGYDVAVIEVAHLGTYDGLGAEVISLGDEYEQHLIDTLSRYLHTDGGDRNRILVIEELPALMSSPVPEMRSRIGDLILSLARLRRTGVVVVAQRMSGWIDENGRDILMNRFDNRVLAGISDSQTRETMLGGSRGIASVTTDDPVGTAVLVTGGRHMKFRPALPKPRQ